MKKLLLLSALLIFACNSDKGKKNDLNRLNLNGKVSWTKEISYKAIYKFGELVEGDEGWRIPDIYPPPPSYDIYRHFNEQGKIVQRTLSQGGDTAYIYFFEYNDKSDIIVEDQFDVTNEDVKLLTKKIFKYDDDGNLSEERVYDGNGEDLLVKIEYNYDGNRNLTEIEYYYPPSGDFTSIKGKFDESGNLIESRYYDKDGELNGKYKYDKDGNLSEERNYDQDGELSSKTKYKYDNKGNMSSKIFISDYESKVTYKYEFDKNDNWIKKIIYEEGKPTFIVNREINYYD